MQTIDVVIPCRNESITVGAIIDSFHASKHIGKVIVVDDKSEDGTWETAIAHGAMVVTGDGIGKGQAVKVGLQLVSTTRVVLCDGDLLGFTVDHANTLTDDFQLSGYLPVEVIGVPDFTPNLPWAHRVKDSEIWSELTGQRSLPTDLVKGIDLHGYAMEVQINRAVAEAGIPIIRRRLRGVKGMIKPGFYQQRVQDYFRDLEWLKENW